jgi:cell shape-determining protein MreC
MEQMLNIILTNPLFLFTAVVLIAALLFSIFKKVLKLLLYAFIALAAFVGYVYYTGVSVNEALDPVQQGVEKAEKSLEENKELKDAKEKIEKELKK